MSLTEIHGTTAPGFEPVAAAFAANFSERGDTAASCAVYAGGRLVVDLWAGATAEGPWTPETRNVVFSVSKGITTICLLMAAEQGCLDLDAPVVEYWPEFTAHDKSGTTARHVLAHQAGLVAPLVDLTPEDLLAWDPVVAALAAQAPAWPPGTAYSYHPITFGWLAGEILRRATGRRPSEWLKNRIAEPLGVMMTYGAELPAPDVALLGDPLPDTDPVAASQQALALSVPMAERSMSLGAVFDATDMPGSANGSAFLGCELPGANLVANARGLAKVYAATVGEVDGVRLLNAATVRDARTVQSQGIPHLGIDEGNRWGTGFMVNSPRRPMVGPGSFGHDGLGGHLAFGDLETQVGFAYQTIRPGGVPDDRAELLCQALRETLASSSPLSVPHPSHQLGAHHAG